MSESSFFVYFNWSTISFLNSNIRICHLVSRTRNRKKEKRKGRRRHQRKEISLSGLSLVYRRCNYASKDNKRGNSKDRVDASGLRRGEPVFYKRNVMIACEPSVYL